MHLFNQIAQKPNIVYVSPSMIDDRIEAIYYKQQYLDADEKIVSFDTGYVFLKDLCSKITDGTHKTPNYTTKGLKFISSKNVSEDGIDFENVKYISKEEHHEISKRCKVEAEDILLTKVGRIGYAKIVPANVPDFSIFVSVALLKLKGNMDNAFIEVFLNSKYGRIQSEKLAKGSNQPDFHLEDIAEIKIPIPSPEIQKYIGDKVRKAEELREEAKRLKKEAEEVLSEKLNVKELLLKINKYTEKHNWINDSDINDRMDALYYNPQKTIIRRFYKKYDLRKLNTLVDYKKGFAFKSEDYCHSSTNTFLLRVSDISNNEVNMDNMIKLSDKFYQEYIDFNLFNEDIVMVVTGNTTGKSVIINNSKSKLLLNQNAIRMRLKDGTNVSTYYIELILQSQYFQTLLKYSLYQSVQPFISMEFLNEVKIPIIDKIEREDISNLYKKSLNNLFYSKQLIQEAKQDVEDLIEGNFDMSKIKVNN